MILFDPGAVYQTSQVLEDGTEVCVRGPLIRFKLRDVMVGLTGGYEVCVDGWWYEEALIWIEMVKSDNFVEGIYR